MLEMLNTYILVKPDKPEEMTEGGIAVPDTAKEKPISGTIIACHDPTFLNNRVFYPSYEPLTISYKLEKDERKQDYHAIKAEVVIMVENNAN